MKGKRGWGEAGEDYASLLLRKKGYIILQKNFRSKLGEIDIIAKEADTLVFVEVKTRWSRKYGFPEEAVNAYKLQKIKRVAEFYLLTHPTAPRKIRIDVVAIEVREGKVSSAKIITSV